MVSLTNIESITDPNDLLDAARATFDQDLDISDSLRLSLRLKIKSVAQALHCEREINTLIDDCYAEFDKSNYKKEIMQNAVIDRRGTMLSTSDNFLLIMHLDPKYATIAYNEVAMRAEVTEDGRTRAWTDSDDAISRIHVEHEYGIHSVQKHTDAFAALLESRKYHPIKRVVEKLKWDGTPRIEALLHTWMGADDDEYTREVSRLIFAGGIHRLYEPGCKFEDMPVLIGGQGAGKSTFVRWLAMEDNFFSELTTIEGKEGIEAIEGSWVVEVSELLALTKTKEQEAVKSYLSRLVDKFRPAYGRRIVERPRSCIFIGTTNREQFLGDKTGARRFYPVMCKNTGYWLFDHEAECREYIRQCWAEAFVRKDEPFMAAHATREIQPLMEQHRDAATEEDIRVGMISAYLERLSGDAVCLGMLWENALGQDETKLPQKADQTQIGMIMRNMDGWERCDRRKNFGKHGNQKYWARIKPVAPPEPSYDTPNNDFPF